MAHNPKLNVYILTLNKKKEEYETFRDLFKLKYNCLANETDKNIFEKYFSEFLNSIGKDDFRKDNKSKKVLGAFKSSPNEINYSITYDSQKNVIAGVIDGGKYGILREYADIDNKDDKKVLDVKQAVLDKFYICLCTPLNSKYGYLLVQSYTEETIQDSLKNFLKQLFAHEDAFYSVIIEPYVPDKFVDKFQKEARVRLFTYTSKIGVSEVLRNEKIIVKEQAFEVTIGLTPLEQSFKPNSEELDGIFNEFDNMTLQDYKLGDFKKKVFIENEKKRKANFNIEKELSNIKPTIYLEDEGITVDENTGLPDFDQIKKFCAELLEEIKSEYNRKIDINE